MLFSLIVAAAVLPALSVDPEVDMGAAEIIRRWEYPVEEYNVTTPDGYILTLFRIPHGRNGTQKINKSKPVVFFMHGLEADCIMWIFNLPDQNAPFIMADLGFDVWLGNYRGNQYGQRHVSMDPRDHEFWKFSWDQMAQYDLPTMLKFVLQKTGAPSIYYIGHSMGTLTAFAAFSTDPELGAKVKRFYGLAPLITVGHISGGMRYIADFMYTWEWAIEHIFGSDQFMPPSWLMKKLDVIVCGNKYTESVCANTLFWMAGNNSSQLNETRVPVYVAHTPAGASTQTVLHFSQMVQSNKFQKFDYGKEQNKKMYNSATPPLYNVSRMETPVSLYWGGYDYLADPTDVENMIPLLKNCVGRHFLSDFNHMDFMWGLRAPEKIYRPIAQEILNEQQ